MHKYAAQETTIGQLLIEQALPESMRGQRRILNAKGVEELFQELAEKHPDQYSDVAKKISDIGRHAATATGGFSGGLRHLQQPAAARRMRMEMQQKLQDIYAQDIPDEEKNKRVLEFAAEAQKRLAGEVYAEALAAKNVMALQADTGVRGNKMNVNSLLGADMLYADNDNKPVPVPVTRSYSMGLTPAQYFAGAFGARKGISDVQSATQDGGYFAKQLNQISHRLVVSGRDDDNYDPASVRGLPVDTDDKFNAGSLLAHPVGGYERNQVLTPKILKELKAAGHDTILIRSPMVGGPADGGVYSYDAGVRERGGLSPVGDFLGLAAAQAISEGVTQSGLSSKHSGGVVGAQAAQLTGFKLFDSLVQVPAVFPGGAAHASQDGRVTNIKEAPQGGYLVSVDSTEHHVPAGLPVTVKVNDVVEAGDVLSSGTPNPAEIVAHKGIGEGRRYFAKTFMKAMQDSGSKLHRRNVELLARGLINHVRLTEEHEDNVPGETYPYQYLESTWQPREGHVIGSPESLRGHYLEKPVLHYTVGTPVKPSMIKEMQKYGVKNIYAHKSPPPFQAEMVRGLASVAEDPDWMTRMLGSYQKSSILDAAHRGAVSDEEGSSYVPALARGTNFGVLGPTKGWDPKKSPVPFPTPGVTPATPTQPPKSVLDD